MANSINNMLLSICRDTRRGKSAADGEQKSKLMSQKEKSTVRRFIAAKIAPIFTK